MSNKDYNVVKYEVVGPAALITLNRPQQLNAWVLDMDHEVRDAVTTAETDHSVTAIIITGEGRGFCAGADMSILADMTDDESALADLPGSDSVGDFDGRFTYLFAVTKPVVAAINGPVAGMGLAFALCCDVRVVSPQAVFVTAFAQRGLIAEWGTAWLMGGLIGPSASLDMLWSSRRVTGEEAWRLGLANYLVPSEELVPFCLQYVDQIASSAAPSSLAIMKRQVYEQVHRGLGDAERESQRLMHESFRRPDFQEGVQSYIDKRPPRFARLPEPE